MGDEGGGGGEGGVAAIQPRHHGRDGGSRHQGDDGGEQFQIRRQGQGADDRDVNERQRDQPRCGEAQEIPDLAAVEGAVEAGSDDDEHEGHRDGTGVPAGSEQGGREVVAAAGPGEGHGGGHAEDGGRQQVFHGGAPSGGAAEREHPERPESDGGTEIEDKEIGERGGGQGGAVLDDEDGEIDKIVDGAAVDEGAAVGGVLILQGGPEQQSAAHAGRHQTKGKRRHEPELLHPAGIESGDDAVEDQERIKQLRADPAPAAGVRRFGITTLPDEPSQRKKAEQLRDGGEDDRGAGQIMKDE